MPKSKVTKRAKQKKLRTSKRAETRRARARNLAGMIDALETYEEHLGAEPLVIDGEVYLNPYQAAAIEQLQKGEQEEGKDAR